MLCKNIDSDKDKFQNKKLTEQVENGATNSNHKLKNDNFEICTSDNEVENENSMFWYVEKYSKIFIEDKDRENSECKEKTDSIAKTESDNNSVNNVSSKKKRLEPKEDSDDDLREDSEPNRAPKSLKNKYKNIKSAKSSKSENFLDSDQASKHHLE